MWIASCVATGGSIRLSHELRGMTREGANTQFATLDFIYIMGWWSWIGSIADGVSIGNPNPFMWLNVVKWHAKTMKPKFQSSRTCRIEWVVLFKKRERKKKEILNGARMETPRGFVLGCESEVGKWTRNQRTVDHLNCLFKSKVKLKM